MGRAEQEHLRLAGASKVGAKIKLRVRQVGRNAGTRARQGRTTAIREGRSNLGNGKTNEKKRGQETQQGTKQEKDAEGRKETNITQ